MRRRGESGQTVTEFLMMSGILTSITITLLGIVQVPVREQFEKVAQCIVDGAINGISCVTGEPVVTPPPAPPPPSPAPPPQAAPPRPAPPPSVSAPCHWVTNVGTPMSCNMCVQNGGAAPYTWRLGPGHTCSWMNLTSFSGTCSSFAGVQPAGPLGSHCDVHIQVCDPAGTCMDVRFNHRPIR